MLRGQSNSKHDKKDSEGRSHRQRKRDAKARKKLMKQYSVSSNPEKVAMAKSELSLIEFFNAIRANEARKMYAGKNHRYPMALYDYQVVLEYCTHFLTPTVRQWELMQAQKLHITDEQRQQISPDMHGLLSYNNQVAIEEGYLRKRFSEIYPNLKPLTDNQFNAIARSRVDYTNTMPQQKSHWSMDDHEIFRAYVK